jgi:hypothetical protein
MPARCRQDQSGQEPVSVRPAGKKIAASQQQTKSPGVILAD